MNKRNRRAGIGHRSTAGLLCVLAMAFSAGAGSAQKAAEAPGDGSHPGTLSAAGNKASQQEAKIKFGGDRLEIFDFAPVYRRCEKLELTVEPPPGMKPRDVRVVLERLGPRREVEYQASLGTTNRAGAAHVSMRLKSPEGPPAVGMYRVAVRAERERKRRRLGSRMFYVIFNAADGADRLVYHPDPAPYLDSELKIQQQRNGERHRFRWSVNPQDPAVFRRAIRAVTGARYPAAAIQRLARISVRQVEGFWPELDDINGTVPESAPAGDLNWMPASVRSVVERLESSDPRGQCFDYTALLVAFARSIGLPATAVSAFDPEPLPHPYDGTTRIEWDYHVWPEVFFRGRWWAVDITYLDTELPVAEQAKQALRNPAPALQPRWGPWFARMVGPRTRLWSDRDDGLREITPAYRPDRGERPRRVGR